ncbi:hypothetical protein WH52_09815 [Tenacibaculum holothuriorum]|uniref:DUF5018 domain-containing protein n=2 Tax=Tenacibaculum holothuriorum TaxID=1635173 RepID=A0A1Y2PD40_9FLAO|nr:hypothetical protein WH52_09815 [Tenacibaculum holothuriorum]
MNKGSFSKNFTIEGNSIIGEVDCDFDLEDITLDIQIPHKASISPDPQQITSLTKPINFTITAENGQKNTYTVLITKKTCNDNYILEFQINSNNFTTKATIDNNKNIITQRIPPYVNLSNLNTTIFISEKATLNPINISDFSSDVAITVTSQSGIKRTYNVKISHMDESFMRTCNEMNAWKWFGGDDRDFVTGIIPYDRNVGTGQAIILEKDLSPTSFSIHLREGFRYDSNDNLYNQPVKIKLNIRNTNEEIIATTITEVSSNFNGGFIPFDLESKKLFFKKNEKYIFQWYLIDGQKLGITASSSGNTNKSSGFCFNGGYTSTSHKRFNNNLNKADLWHEHDWNFNIKIEGLQ